MGIKLTNLDKMNQLVGGIASAKEVINWASMNRIWLADLPDNKQFKEMRLSVSKFLKREEKMRAESEMWEDFLNEEYRD